MNRKSKTRLLSSIAIFISGYTPLFLIMVIKDVKAITWYEHNLDSSILSFSKISIPYWFEFKNVEIVVSLLLFSLLSLALLSYVIKNVTKKPFPIHIVAAKSRSSEVVNYTIPYMISFVAFDLSKWQDILSLFLFLSVLCLLSVRSQSVFINPILAALGYGLYDCKYNEEGNDKECVLLSQHDLLAGNNESYVKLNNYMGIISNKGT
ncbi:hypothetical protein P7M12_07665 [Vibrio parahaemolyticus]|nr:MULTISPECIES: hypothetical protein [Vibrio]EJG1820159.1 hypothetical protein [Vibrio parahaemolyticus]ELX4136787.1 hypothetical protein [Vibrio vulnificus]MCU8444092.1 hypothetical protein [Vibrio vulnificus]MDG2655582.1 hypothetical protein [Vibrio parahaemolyticus]